MKPIYNRNEILEKLIWIAKVRSVAGIVVLILFGGMRLTGIMEFPFLMFSFAPVLVIFANQPYPFFVRKIKDLSNLFFISQVIDIFLITWGIYFLGGMSMFTGILIYPLVIIVTGIVLGGKRTYLMANISFLVYSLMVYFESQGIIPAISTIDVRVAKEARIALTVTICPFFNLIAFYAAYLSNMALKKEKQLREIQERLKRHEKLTVLGKFAGIVAHELRTPLGVMKNATYFLRMKLKDIETGEKINDILTKMDNEINVSEKIINDTLSFVKLKESEKSKENINDIIRYTIEKMEIDDHIDIKLDLEANIPEIFVDHSQIYRAFHNIILNAVQSIQEKGEIEITSFYKSGYIEITVTDNGIGISKENIKNVFEPLFSTKTIGTGFGLSVSQSIIKMHKGFIGVTSTEGKGSTFTIKIPV